MIIEIRPGEGRIGSTESIAPRSVNDTDVFAGVSTWLE